MNQLAENIFPMESKKFIDAIRIGIVGSRKRDSSDDKNLIEEEVFRLMEKYHPRKICLISGGCPKGADKFAEQIAKEIGLSILIHYPEKWTLPENPNKWNWTKIFYKRNEYIAEDCDILIALPVLNKKGGTDDTIKKAKKLGKEVILL